MTYSSQTRALGVSTLGLLIYNPREKNVNIPSERDFYVHIYMCVYVYIHTYVKWMSTGFMLACLKKWMSTGIMMAWHKKWMSAGLLPACHKNG